MHHALEIGEILADIFRHCTQADLSSLARTCHTFKEPALDALWEELGDLSPLARCLPEASYKRTRFQYSFGRPLTSTKWDVVRGYARRIRYIRHSSHELNTKTLRILSNPPTADSLFTNLRSLGCEYDTAALLLRLPLPSLLHITFYTGRKDPNSPGLDDFLKVFPQLCPNVRRAFFPAFDRSNNAPSENAVSDCVRRWQRLEDMSCPSLLLDAMAIVHLSRIGCLTKLCFALDTPLQQFESPLTFPNLHELSLRSKRWSSFSEFLSCVQLPTIAQFNAITVERPSRPELSSVIASVLSGASRTIRHFYVDHQVHLGAHPIPFLGLDDLRPCMAFSHLRLLKLDIRWNVDLTDTDLLTLASAWPHLEGLRISESWGWNTTGGITTNGLLRLLQTCPSLCSMALAMNTRDDAGFMPSQESLGQTLPRPFMLGVLDSIIEEDAVTSVSAFFARVASLPCFYLYVGRPRREWPNRDVHSERWRRVYELAQDMIRERRPTAHA